MGKKVFNIARINGHLSRVRAEKVKDRTPNKKMSLRITPVEEINQLSKINTRYERVTDMEQVLIDSLDWESDIKQWQWMTPTALCTLLEVPSTQARKMGRALTALANNSEYEGIKKKRTNVSRFTIKDVWKANDNSI